MSATASTSQELLQSQKPISTSKCIPSVEFPVQSGWYLDKQKSCTYLKAVLC